MELWKKKGREERGGKGKEAASMRMCAHTRTHIHTLRGEGEREKGEVSKYCFVP